MICNNDHIFLLVLYDCFSVKILQYNMVLYFVTVKYFLAFMYLYFLAFLNIFFKRGGYFSGTVYDHKYHRVFHFVYFLFHSILMLFSIPVLVHVHHKLLILYT
uniref:NADH dehydrogenase subunit 4 n=1 Tax=Engystomops pustulosus TaxID=76066 RepID=A0AAV6Z5P8_ENGPU|nr:hypothetical protein GDO81_028596 [Engystomops pustulosus]